MTVKQKLIDIWEHETTQSTLQVLAVIFGGGTAMVLFCKWMVWLWFALGLLKYNIFLKKESTLCLKKYWIAK